MSDDVPYRGHWPLPPPPPIQEMEVLAVSDENMNDFEFCTRTEAWLEDGVSYGYLAQGDMDRISLLMRLGALARLEAARAAE